MHFDTYFTSELPRDHRLLSTTMHRSMAAPSACYREIMRFLSILTGAAWAVMLNAQAASINSYTPYLPEGASLAFLAQKAGASTPLMDYHSKQMALPASTMKILTALAALLQLGPDFRFTTTLESRNGISGDRLKGDLIARFVGDPSFSRQDMRNMVAQLKQQGVKHIDGNIVIDTSIFASHDKSAGLAMERYLRVLQYTACGRNYRPQLLFARFAQRSATRRQGARQRSVLLPG